MNQSVKEELLNRTKTFFRDNIVINHNKGLIKAGHLSSYDINPFLISYLANFLCGDNSSIAIAKALIYPRVLGTSVTTIFGGQTQKMISTIFAEGFASTTSGIDIEYIDSVDGRKKYCQLKSGPNTINKDDVVTIRDHFKGVIALARTNNLSLGIDDMVVGVLYGDAKSLSANYRKVAESYPVVVGQDFWYRLTSDKNFYSGLINAFGQVAQEVDCTETLDRAINQLATEIENADSLKSICKSKF